MEGKVGKVADRISDLPVPVLHQILTFLPIKDAIKTSVLSKQWNSIQKCFPVLNFRLVKRRPKESVESADRTLQNFVRSKLCMVRVSIGMYYFDSVSVPVVNTWLPLALHNGVSDLIFDRFYAGKENRYYPLPETTFSINSTLLRGSSKSFNLQKLELSGVLLSDRMVRDIFQNCPNLSDLSLSDIFGLDVLIISKPEKLTRLSIMVGDPEKEFKCIVVDALSLDRFSLAFDDRDSPSVMVDLTFCSNLRELKLDHDSIIDDSFNLNISRLPLLEVLDIIACYKLEFINISLNRLKHLTVDDCDCLKVIEIDAPLLSKFVYKPWFGELAELVLPHEIPGSMYLLCWKSTCEPEVDSSWFFEIREFLTVPFKGINFSFCAYEDGSSFDPEFEPSSDPEEPSFQFEELSFDHDDLREALAPQLVEVACLDLSDLCIKHSYHWETLLDGLLWSCHPKMVRVKVTTTHFRYTKNWIKIEVLCKMLNESECRLCCNLPHCKCWRYRLKYVKIESIKGIEFRDLNFQNVKDYCLSNPEDDEVQFIFDWDHFANVKDCEVVYFCLKK